MRELPEGATQYEADCIGQRLTSDGKLCWFFKSPELDAVTFGLDVKGHYGIGWSYLMTRVGENKHMVSGEFAPKKVGESTVDEAVRAFWATEHMAAKARFEAKRGEKRAQKLTAEHNTLVFASLTLREIKAEYHTLRTTNDRAALLAHVITAIQGY